MRRAELFKKVVLDKKMSTGDQSCPISLDVKTAVSSLVVHKCLWTTNELTAGLVYIFGVGFFTHLGDLGGKDAATRLAGYLRAQH